jgi:hypothetical protein
MKNKILSFFKATHLNNKMSLLFISVALFSSACKKDTYNNPTPLLASVTVINAASELGAIYMNLYTDPLSYALRKDSIAYQEKKEWGIQSGTTELSAVSYRDTLQQLFKGSFNFTPLAIYSLYITDQDTILRAEPNIPIYKDSAIGVRFINLSANSPAVNITASDILAFSGLTYKQQSEFKKFPLGPNDGLSFDIRDAGTNEVITSFTLQAYAYYPYNAASVQTSRFKSITLAISGTYGTDSYNVFAITNY